VWHADPADHENMYGQRTDTVRRTDNDKADASGMNTIRLPEQALRSWIHDLLIAAGLPEGQVSDATEVFVRSSLRAVGHHDISYLPQRLQWLQDARVNPAPAIRLVGGGSAAEVWDGDHGLGEVCCTHITRRAIALSRQFGIGFASIRNSNHFLAAGPYTEMGSESSCLTMVFSNTDAGMSAPGGTKNIIGNNPVGFGVPLAPPVQAHAGKGGGTDHLLFDVCMAYSSLGNLKALSENDTRVPAHWGSDSQGRPSIDPESILQGGSVHPMGGHKGFGLALLVELLTGGLSAGPTGDQVLPGGGINTHNQSVIAFDLAQFGLDASMGMAERASDLANRLKAAQPGLRLPGERSAAARTQAMEQGIAVRDDTLISLHEWSRKLSVKPPL